MTTDFDLDRLGDVWRQQPDPAELEKLKRSAASVSRRARWAQLFDIATATAVAAVVLFIVIAYPQRTTVAMGSAAILVLLYANVRSRRIRQLELRSLAGTTENMLDQSIERLEAAVKYNRVTLIAFGPTILVGILFAASANLSSDQSLVVMIRSLPTLRTFLGVGGLAAIAGFAIFLLLSLRRARRELQRLAAMRDSFREERKSSNY